MGNNFEKNSEKQEREYINAVTGERVEPENMYVGRLTESECESFKLDPQKWAYRYVWMLLGDMNPDTNEREMTGIPVVPSDQD